MRIVTVYLEEHGDESASYGFDLEAYAAKHGEAALDTLIAAGLRNMVRDQRSLAFDDVKAAKKAGLKGEELAALEEAAVYKWKAAAAERLDGWMKDGYRPGGGGKQVSDWVKLARVKVAAIFAKKGVKGEAKLNGLTLAQVKGADEATLRAYVGPTVAAKWDAELADDDLANLS